MTTTQARPAGDPVVDTSTEFGAHVAERLQREHIAWLTTVGRSGGTPQPNPVWFLWRDGEFLLFSKPNQAKLRNIEANPRVSLNLNSSESGGEIAILTGSARIDSDGATEDEIADFTTKYREPMVPLGYTAEQFYADYSVLVRITPDRLRGF
ncbi:TIGR03667 family PPOX class F420-dependent oxidoreductase [Nocardia transvalensis]|uniref:TIGR03667 family PPOX class F420-dependent oxidoreductase n=1 Tax=Nocardia transvalensis TaxID=37333 RepID=UPI00189481FD|nr:TIGR03667 family PPOX class F420-dependent oxidoreductase [Nocardia transvalensis]MBF6327589.1 TIGR03667 family PPOX class F420-dependent oxidoreductase [Nocardia transvalensis]